MWTAICRKVRFVTHETFHSILKIRKLMQLKWLYHFHFLIISFKSGICASGNEDILLGEFHGSKYSFREISSYSLNCIFRDMSVYMGNWKFGYFTCKRKFANKPVYIHNQRFRFVFSPFHSPVGYSAKPLGKASCVVKM